jgi:hypothetical protein
VHVTITEFALRKRPWDAELEGKGIFAFEKTHFLDRASVELGKRSSIQRSGIFDTPVAGKVSEHDVKREYERTCILASNQICDIG